ncbi:MAG: 4Fe-4S dicluster domain-containing protein [Deltaproteobacteria bacterium]|jgi:predicted aldo/keto reductase-like oxidoreductase|nr:4Fe-4S dicluster domain-containing protein [Deltaproteobacteria bacterium]
MAQVEENLALVENYKEGLFRPEDEIALNKVRAFFLSRIKADCSGCGYCLPCPAGVDIPKNLLMFNQYFLFEGQDAKDLSHKLYHIEVATEKMAKNCLNCGECLERCPQSLAIPDFLAQTADLFQTLES